MNTESQELSKIEKLKLKQQKIAAQIQREEARHKTRERKEETRRKILLGAYFLDKINKDGTFETIKQELDAFLKRNSDRILFQLPPLENESS